MASGAGHAARRGGHQGKRLAGCVLRCFTCLPRRSSRLGFRPVGTASAGKDVFCFHLLRRTVIRRPSTGHSRAVCHCSPSHVFRSDRRRHRQPAALSDLGNGCFCGLCSFSPFPRPLRGAGIGGGVW